MQLTSTVTTRRRSLRFRCSALLWAVVFVLSGVRPAFGSVECAHHQAHHGAEAAEAHAGHGAADGHGRHHADAQHPEAHHAAGAGALPAAPGPDGHDGVCTCVGPCHAGSGPVVLSAPLVTPVGAVARVAHAAPGRDVAALPGRSAHLLPFATAPPQGR